MSYRMWPVYLALWVAVCVPGWVGLEAGGQTGSLPDAPSTAPVTLVLPGGAHPAPAAPVTVRANDAKDAPVSPPVDEEEWCTAPSETSFRSPQSLSKDEDAAMWRYMAAFHQQVMAHWRVPRGVAYVRDNTTVQIRLQVLKDGQIVDPVIMMSSGKKAYDKSALESVVKAAPFAPLPKGVEGPLKLCLVHIYNRNEKEKPVDPFAPKTSR